LGKSGVPFHDGTTMGFAGDVKFSLESESMPKDSKSGNEKKRCSPWISGVTYLSTALSTRLEHQLSEPGWKPVSVQGIRNSGAAR